MVMSKGPVGVMSIIRAAMSFPVLASKGHCSVTSVVSASERYETSDG